MEVLKWVAGGGCAVISAMLISYLAEKEPRFQALDSDIKRFVMIFTSLVLGLTAWAVMTYVPAEVLAQLQAPFEIIFLAVSATLANQAWHSLVNKPTTRPSP